MTEFEPPPARLHRRLRPSIAALTGVGALLTARVVAGVATLGLFALLARTLTVTEFGLFGLAWSVSYLFAAFAEGGYGMLVVRDVAATPSLVGYFFGAFLPIRVALAAAMFLAATWLSATVGWDSTVVVLIMAAAAANLQVVSGVPREFLIGTDRAELASLHAIIETILRTLVIIGVAVLTHSVTAIFASAALFHAAWLLVCIPPMWRLFKPTDLRVGARSWWKVLRRSLPFGTFIVLGAIYAQMDVVIVSALLPLAAVATFQVALRIMVATEYVPEAAWRWAYPRLSLSSGRAVSDFGSQTTALAVSLLAVGGCVALVLVVISPWMIPFLFGATYVTAVFPMQIMSTAIPLRYGAHVYGTAFSAAGLQGLRSRAFLAVVFAAVLLEVALVMTAGLDGALVAIFVSSSLLLGTYVTLAHRAWGAHIDRRPPALTWVVTAVVLIVIVATQR